MQPLGAKDEAVILEIIVKAPCRIPNVREYAPGGWRGALYYIAVKSYAASCKSNGARNRTKVMKPKCVCLVVDQDDRLIDMPAFDDQFFDKSIDEAAGIRGIEPDIPAPFGF